MMTPAGPMAMQAPRYLPLGGGTLTGPLLLPDGSATVPALAFASDADGSGTGFYRGGANIVSLSINGAWTYDWTSSRARMAAGGVLEWYGRTLASSPADGVVLLTNNAGTDVGLLKLGGTTSSYPAWKRESTAVAARLADDSSYAQVNGSAFYSKSGSTHVIGASGGGALMLASSAVLRWSQGSDCTNTADVRARRVAANVLGIDNGTNGQLAALELCGASTTDIGAGATGSARLFARDNGAGKTQLCVRFSTGAVQVVATEP